VKWHLLIVFGESVVMLVSKVTTWKLYSKILISMENLKHKIRYQKIVLLRMDVTLILLVSVEIHMLCWCQLHPNKVRFHSQEEPQIIHFTSRILLVLGEQLHHMKALTSLTFTQDRNGAVQIRLYLIATHMLLI
jgi:hypothetical protein